jgi:hypothetical protein
VKSCTICARRVRLSSIRSSKLSYYISCYISMLRSPTIAPAKFALRR